MQTLRRYRKPEDAYIDAGFLCSMGIQAVVTQEPAYGGVLLGAVQSPCRLDVPNAQAEHANSLLSQRPDEDPPRAQKSPMPVDAKGLQTFFRIILIYDTICWIGFSVFGNALGPELPQPVVDFLQSLALSDALWRLAYMSYWPLVILGVLSNILCYFCQPFGRSLFTFITVWSTLTTLGPPPLSIGPYHQFFGTLQLTFTGIALALMYWSPLRDRFTK